MQFFTAVSVLLPLMPPTVLSATTLALTCASAMADCIAAPTAPPTLLLPVMLHPSTAAAVTAVLVRMSPVMPPTLVALGVFISLSLNDTLDRVVLSAAWPMMPPTSLAEASPSMLPSYT